LKPLSATLSNDLSSPRIAILSLDIGIEMPNALPNALTLFPGTLDDTNWFKLDRMIWACSAQDWYEFPSNIEKLEKNIDYNC
jgi:hypothetical protein